MPACTEDVCQQLGIIGSEDAAEHEWPDFSLAVEDGAGSCQCVRVNFKKYGHEGVVIWSRRGAGAWEKLDKDTRTPFMDERPLLVPGQPEVREYRLQFFDDDVTGNFTPVQSATVS